MTRRPLIAITTHPRVVEVATGPTRLHTLSRHYSDSVERAGGLAVALPTGEPATAEALVARIDGLVLTGGGDVWPGRYGEEADEHTGAADEDRDTFELAMVAAALDAGLGVLAICRGLQVLNVALGGSLVQHVETTTGLAHDDTERWASTVHSVTVDPISRLGVLIGEALDVNSIHHQAVGRPGKGVRPVAWASDGTVEAIEVDGRPEIVAVQWHPELLGHRPEQRRLFENLVAHAINR